MGHARDPNELLEVARDELRSVVRDDSVFRLRILFLGSLQDNFDLRSGNRLPQIPMHQETTVSIQHTAHVVERARQVDVGNIDVPVSVGLRRLLKPRPFARGLALPSRQQSRLLQHSPYARRTHRHDLCIQHHERQPPIALQGILQMKTDDGFLLPRLQPEIAGESNRGAHSLARSAVASCRTCWPQCPTTAGIVQRGSRSSPTNVRQNPRLDPAYHAAPSSWSELPKTFF